MCKSKVCQLNLVHAVWLYFLVCNCCSIEGASVNKFTAFTELIELHEQCRSDTEDNQTPERSFVGKFTQHD